MIISAAITRVRDIAGDASALQFTDDQIVNWMNDGIRECAIINNLLQKRSSLPSIANTPDYNLPTDILKLHSVKYDNTKIPVLTLQEFDEQYVGVGANTSVSPGNPEVCYIWANKLTLYPAPSGVKNITIDYIYDPVQVTTGDLAIEIPLPVGYHLRIVDWCLAQIAQQDDDMNRYSVKMQQFTTGVQDLKDQPESTYDLYPSISVSSRDSGEGYYYD